MKLLIPLLLLLFDSAVMRGQVYRWDYKILIDTSGVRVYEKMAFKRTTIHTLTKIARPSDQERKNRRAEAEKRKVYFTAFVIGIGEEDDGDYHLILKDVTTDSTLIAEIPDAAQQKIKNKFPGLEHDYSTSRQFIEENIDSNPGSIHDLATPVKVRVYGVVFFDKAAHGNGHAANGVEVHPVLKIKSIDQ